MVDTVCTALGFALLSAVAWLLLEECFRNRPPGER